MKISAKAHLEISNTYYCSERSFATMEAWRYEWDLRGKTAKGCDGFSMTTWEKYPYTPLLSNSGSFHCKTLRLTSVDSFQLPITDVFMSFWTPAGIRAVVKLDGRSWVEEARASWRGDKRRAGGEHRPTPSSPCTRQPWPILTTLGRKTGDVLAK